MYILHIETATRFCSVALSKEGEFIAGKEDAGGMTHAALLTPMIRTVIGEGGITMDQLGGVTVSAGPGSYTGLRVGVATAKSIAYSLSIPLAGISTLTALAWAMKAKHDQPSAYFLPMIDARRMEVYCSLLDSKLYSVWPEQAVVVDGSFIGQLQDINRPLILGGDGVGKLKSVLAGLAYITIDDEINCDARHLIEPGWEALKGSRTSDVFHFTPTYLKAPNITTPRKPV